MRRRSTSDRRQSLPQAQGLPNTHSLPNRADELADDCVSHVTRFKSKVAFPPRSESESARYECRKQILRRCIDVGHRCRRRFERPGILFVVQRRCGADLFRRLCSAGVVHRGLRPRDLHSRLRTDLYGRVCTGLYHLQCWLVGPLAREPLDLGSAADDLLRSCGRGPGLHRGLCANHRLLCASRVVCRSGV